MIEFKCTNCGMEVRVGEEYAGKKGRCPHCRAVNEIPPLPGAEAAAAPEEAAARPPETQTPPPPKPARKGPSIPVPAAQIDRLLGALRPRLGERLFNAAEKSGYLIGAYGLVAVAALALIAAIVRATGHESQWAVALAGPDTITLVILAFLMLVGQYVLVKIRSASLKIIEASPSWTASTNLLDCVAVLLLLGAAAALVAAIVASTETDSADSGLILALGGVLGAFLLILVASLALNPRALNVSVRARESAGSEAMGLLSFVLKLVLRAAPLALGGLIAFSALGLIQAVRLMVKVESGLPLVGFAYDTCILMLWFTGLYLLLYVTFLFYHLFVDAVTALFQIRDNTRREKQSVPPGDRPNRAVR